MADALDYLKLDWRPWSGRASPGSWWLIGRANSSAICSSGDRVAGRLVGMAALPHDFVPDPSSLRIVWQLIEGEAIG